METSKLRTYIESANINFLFGSGLSRPYLSTLGDIEKWLTELVNDITITDNVRKVIKASIYREYFTEVILPNYNPDKDNKHYITVIGGYKNFLMIWNEIINKRANRLLSKQVNIYTTNIDILIENATEEVQIEFNDGFKGTIKQIFDESNFQKSYNKTSLHFQNISEIPVFNLLKMHGSINWKDDDEKITNDYLLCTVNEINVELQKIDSSLFIETVCPDCGKNNSYEQLSKEAQNRVNDVDDSSKFDLLQQFLDFYEKLIVVNPTKQKFVESVIELHFYELMRMYSNSLEKENSILFVMGFSFADEHITKITLRAANTNPTLFVVIFSYDDEQEAKYSEVLKSATNNNIHIITPSKFNVTNHVNNDKKRKKIKEINFFNLATINSVFDHINQEIPINIIKYGK